MAYTTEEYIQLVNKAYDDVMSVYNEIIQQYGDGSIELKRRCLSSDCRYFKITFKVNNKEIPKELIDRLANLVEDYNERVDYLVKTKLKIKEIEEKVAQYEQLMAKRGNRININALPVKVKDSIKKIEVNKEAINKGGSFFGMPLLFKDVNKEKFVSNVKVDFFTKYGVGFLFFVVTFPLLVTYILPLLYNILIMINVFLLSIIYGIVNNIPKTPVGDEIAQWTNPLVATLLLKWFKENYEVIVTLIFLLIFLAFLYKLSRRDVAVVEKIGDEQRKI